MALNPSGTARKSFILEGTAVWFSMVIAPGSFLCWLSATEIHFFGLFVICHSIYRRIIIG
jgi:hypothetical protein